MAHPELAVHIQEGRLWLISEDFGMARVGCGRGQQRLRQAREQVLRADTRSCNCSESA